MDNLLSILCFSLVIIPLPYCNSTNISCAHITFINISHLLKIQNSIKILETDMFSSSGSHISLHIYVKLSNFHFLEFNLFVWFGFEYFFVDRIFAQHLFLIVKCQCLLKLDSVRRIYIFSLLMINSIIHNIYRQ